MVAGLAPSSRGDWLVLVVLSEALSCLGGWLVLVVPIGGCTSAFLPGGLIGPSGGAILPVVLAGPGGAEWWQ